MKKLILKNISFNYKGYIIYKNIYFRSDKQKFFYIFNLYLFTLRNPGTSSGNNSNGTNFS